jgi:hypothetical protein
MPPHKQKPGAAGTRQPGKCALSKSGSLEDSAAPRVGQPIDRFGNVYSESIYRNWTAAAIRALGIYRVGDEPEGGAR